MRKLTPLESNVPLSFPNLKLTKVTKVWYHNTKPQNEAPTSKVRKDNQMTWIHLAQTSQNLGALPIQSRLRIKKRYVNIHNMTIRFQN